MALTKIGTDGVKDDAVTSGKIPANAVGSSELADNAVENANIANNAVTSAKIANDAVTGVKIAAEIDNSHITSSANIAGSKLADNSITLAKLTHGDGSSDGKFLRSNNGADPTFETVSTDLVADTTPQLGGNLDVNTKNIVFGDSGSANDDRLVFGAGSDLSIYHNGNESKIEETGTGGLRINTSVLHINKGDQSETMASFTQDGAVQLYYDNGKKFETKSNGVTVSNTGDAQLTILSDSDDNGSNNWSHIDFRVNNLSGTTQARLKYREDNACLAVDIAGQERVGVNQHGLVFNGDTAAANALDDYEEGSFSPTVASGGTASSYTHQYGYYIKIGRMVHWQIYMSINGSGSSSQFQLGSFPFTAGAYNSTAYGGATVGYANNTFQTDNMYMYMQQNNTTLMFVNRAGQAIAGNSAAIFAGSDFIIFGQYVTA